MGFYADHERGMVDAEAAGRHAAAAGLSVDAENVLYVRKAILDEYESLLQVLVQETRGSAAYPTPYGGDPVSSDAAVAFPERVAVLLEQCKTHVMSLLAMADKLKEAALAYGYTESEISAAAPVEPSIGMREIKTTINAVLNPWIRS
jgi:hypothetical protein